MNLLVVITRGHSESLLRRKGASMQNLGIPQGIRPQQLEGRGSHLLRGGPLKAKRSQEMYEEDFALESAEFMKLFRHPNGNVRWMSG